MVAAITNDIKIIIEVEFQQKQPNGLLMENIFAYRITIENQSDHTVKLLRRHWFIIDSAYSQREVEGEGVVGLQPIIEPGGIHQYVSGCNIKSDIGKMYGFYTIEKLIDGKKFKVTIPSFNLVVPYILN
ncbi:MAG: Co2+/Mg2+ efflux protein ApaG [Bacteroidetes bacterium]|nr:Co2+/Mg2+ efflux protein ApaG [Bacteroidota bacterium]